MLVSLIKIILVALALYVLWRACERLVHSVRMMSQQRSRPNTTVTGHAVDELVQDPVCKVYVPRREAVVLRDRETDVFFCSKTCRDTFVQRQSG